MARISLLLTLSIALFVAGCGDSTKPVTAPVSGSVSFNGEPVAKGTLMFIPHADVKGSPVQIECTDGKYTSPSKGIPVGMNKVQILAVKKTGKKFKNPDNVMEDEYVQYIPTQFNEESTLNVEIKKGSNTHDFILKE